MHHHFFYANRIGVKDQIPLQFHATLVRGNLLESVVVFGERFLTLVLWSMHKSKLNYAGYTSRIFEQDKLSDLAEISVNLPWYPRKCTQNISYLQDIFTKTRQFLSERIRFSCSTFPEVYPTANGLHLDILSGKTVKICSPNTTTGSERFLLTTLT